MKLRYLLTIVLFSTSPFFSVGMEMPPSQRIKRGPEAIVEPEPKFQKLLWHNLDRWLMRFPEQARLEQFAQVIRQSPSFNFWSWTNDVKVADVPMPSPETSEAWNTLRQVLINQMNAASPQMKAQLAQLALAYQGHFGVASLIGYFANTLVFQPDNIDLAKILKPIIKTLVSQANEEIQFEALYTTIKIGIMDPPMMIDTLDILVAAGINLYAKDKYGKTILDYIAENKIPLANQLPLERLRGYFYCETAFRAD